MKKINYRHYIAIAILLGLTAWTVFATQSIFRLWESIRDFAISWAYYFVEYWAVLTGNANTVSPTVVTVSNYIDIQAIIPLDWETFKINIAQFGSQLFSADNFRLYAVKVSKGLTNFMLIATLLIPMLFAAFAVVKHNLLSESGKERAADSKPLQIHRKLEKKLYRPVIDWIKDFFDFLKPVYRWLFLAWFLIHTNLGAIVLEAVAYLIYWVVSLDFSQLYLQVYKLVMDVGYLLTTLPLIVWLVIALKIFDVWRKARGLNKLRKHENKNREFIENLALVIMFVGTMGKNKTTVESDVMMTQEVLYRENSFEIVQEFDMRFPCFPWQTFEAFLQEETERRGIWSLPSINRKMHELEERFRADPTPDNLFGYDFHHYGIEYKGELKVEGIFDVMTTYAQAYYIYAVSTSLIYSNYSVRSDNVRQSNGHFHTWATDFFDRDSTMQAEESSYSHIINFDMLRPKKQVNGKPHHKLGFGVYGIDEIGKERGNQVENADLKKSDIVANQKNDGFNAIVKMMRHLATVFNIPFIRFFSTENRASSVNADLKELTTVVTITDKSKDKLALFGFSIEELIHDLIYNPFMRLYYEYRFVRSDNTLFVYLFKRVAAAIHKYYNDINNKFGYFIATLSTQSGTQEGTPEIHKYYVSKKKIYSDRFCTNCFSEMLTTDDTEPVSIDDVPTYETTKASAAEIAEQNSYFANDLANLGTTPRD